MNENLSNKDWETLSAYLDGELSKNDRKKLELRLYSDQELQNALGDLGKLRQLLRSRASLRAPRNFFLNQAQYERVVKQDMQRTGLPIWGLATAVASFLLLLSGFDQARCSSSVHSPAIWLIRWI